MTTTSPPRVFISYAWEDDDHKRWVEQLATQLRDDGVLARLDQWDREDGQSITGFMISEIEDADVVLVICSPGYIERVRAMERNEAVSGVGLEWDVVSTAMFQSGEMNKLVSALGRGTFDDAIPSFLTREPVFDLTGANGHAEYDRLFQRLTKQKPAGPPVNPEVRPVQHPQPKPLFGRPPTSSIPRHNLPPRYERFKGRDVELGALHDALSSTGPVSLIQSGKQCLTGMGGVGKTLLALEYAYRHFEEYDKILWVDAEGDDLAAGLVSLAPTLDLRLPEDMPVAEQADQIRQALESGLSCLLILDNVDRPGVCDQLLPRVGKTRVLITSRRRDLGLRGLDVDVLPEDKALDLLLGDLVRDEQTVADGLALCAEFGFLTLAIDVAGKILSLGLNGPGDLLAIVREKGPLEWSNDADEDNLFGQQPQLGKLFETSLNLLGTETPVDELGRKMFFCGGWFAPESIPLELLADAASRVETDNTDSPSSPKDLGQRGGQRLLALGLARAEGRGRISLHRVIRDFARKKGGIDFRTAVHDLLSEIADATEGDALKLLSLAPLRPHLETLLGDLSPESPQGHTHTACRLARYYWHSGQYEKTLQVVGQGQRFATEKKLSAWLLGEKGHALSSLGKYEEALEHFQKALAIKVKVLGEQHPDTASTLYAIGQTLHGQAKYEKALEHYQKALAIEEKVLGEQHPHTASTLNAIGQTLHGQSKYEEALEYYQRDLAITEKTLGEQHLSTAMSRFDLGRVLRAMGDEKGEPMMRAAIELAETILGHDHPTVKTMKSWL